VTCGWKAVHAKGVVRKAKKGIEGGVLRNGKEVELGRFPAEIL